MSFLTQEWLFGLFLIPVILLCAIFSRRSQARAWKSLVAPRLAHKLVHKTSSLRHWVSLSLALAAFGFIICALARPYQGEVTMREKVRSRNILIAVDSSKSMLCKDIASDRLTAAKSYALQLLKQFPTDKIGLLAFAGSSKVIAPLTVDHLAVHDTISQLDTHSIPLGGSNLADAVSLGVETLKATGKRANALIIFSDGEEHDSGIDKAIKEAKAAGVQVITIGVGTLTGGVIPSEQDAEGKHRNQEGAVVHTRLHEELLRELAIKTNGAYTSINNRPGVVINSAIEQMDSFEQEGRKQTIPHERYAWFVLPAVVCVLLSAFARARWKSTTPMALILSFVSFFTPEQASAQRNWLAKQQQQLFTKPAAKKRAYLELKEQKHDEAISSLNQAMQFSTGEERARLSTALGQAYYRKGDYKKAAKAYSTALLSNDEEAQAKANYNLANSIFKQHDETLKAIGIEPHTKEELSTLKRTLNDCLEKYQTSLDHLPKDYVTKNIRAIEQLIKKVEEEENKQQKKISNSSKKTTINKKAAINKRTVSSNSKRTTINKKAAINKRTVSSNSKRTVSSKKKAIFNRRNKTHQPLDLTTVK